VKGIVFNEFLISARWIKATARPTSMWLEMQHVDVLFSLQDLLRVASTRAVPVIVARANASAANP
jgi:hypothetical protein